MQLLSVLYDVDNETVSLKKMGTAMMRMPMSRLLQRKALNGLDDDCDGQVDLKF